VCGAAMTAFVDPSGSYIDGVPIISLVFLLLGGAWTLGGLIFWLIAWWRLKPENSPHKIRSNVVSAAYDNPAVQLEAVISHPCETSSDRAISSCATSDHAHQIKTNSEQTDPCSSAPDDVIYVVP